MRICKRVYSLVSKHIIHGVFLGALMAIAGTASGQVTINHSARPRVTLIGPSNPNYDSYLQIGFPAVYTSSQFQSLKAGTVLLRNDTAYPVKAIVVKWEIRGADGTRKVVYHSMMPEPLSFGGVPGYRNLLGPGKILLVSPVADVLSGAPTFAGQRFVQQLTSSETVSTPVAVNTVVGSIDSLVFGNGTIVGPDTFNMSEQFTSRRQAAIDEAKSLVPILSDRVAVLNQLNSDVAANVGKKTVRAQAQVEAATRLAELYRRVDSSKFQSAVLALSEARGITLTKWTPAAHPGQ